MKKVLPVLILVLFVMFAFVAPAFAQGETPPKVEDSQAIVIVLELIGTIAVTWGIQSVASKWNINITEKATQLTAALVLLTIEILDKLIALLPQFLWTPAGALIIFVGTLLSAFGVASYMNRLLPPKPKAKSQTI